METIIGLLFVLLPVIFKMIGKKLEQAGQYEKAGKVREIVQEYLEPESDSDDQVLEDISSWFNTEPETKTEVPVVEPVKEISFEDAAHVLIRRKQAEKKQAPVFLEEKPQKNKEKIDPKKMVIYSEIMKPKYQDQGIV